MTITVGSLTSSDPELAAIAATTATVNTFPVYTSLGPPVVVTNKPITAFAFTFLDDADALTVRTTIGAAPLASPHFTGTPQAPNPLTLTGLEQIATTPYVNSQISNATSGLFLPLVGGTLTGTLSVTGPGVDFILTATTSAAQMYINAPVNYQSYIYFKTGTAATGLRWVIGKEGTPESGSNTGAKFLIYAYDDVGNPKGSCVTIERETRIANFAIAPTIGTPPLPVATVQYVDNETAVKAPLASPVFTGTATFGGQVNVNSDLYIDRIGDADHAIMIMRADTPVPNVSNFASYIYFESGSKLRWLIGKNGTIETGSGNSGSNFYILGHDDAGAAIPGSAAVFIERSSRIVTFGVPPLLASSPSLTDNTTKLATTAWVTARSTFNTITPIMYGAVGDNATNDQAALQAAINACPAGGIIDGLGKTYKVNKVSDTLPVLTLKANMTLQNIIINARDISDAIVKRDPINIGDSDPTIGGILFTVTGSLSAAKTIFDLADGGSDHVEMNNLTDTQFFAPYDWVLIMSNDIWDQKDDCPMSEILQVKSLDTTEHFVYFYTSIKYSMPTSPRLYKINTIDDLRLINVKAYGDNGVITLTDDPHSAANNPYYGQQGAQLNYCKDLIIKDCDFQFFADRALALYMCINPIVSENTLGHCRSDYAYGVQLQAGTLGARVTENFFIDCNHGVDFGDDEAVSRHTVISDNTLVGMRNGGIDAHAATDDCLIDSNVIRGTADPEATAAIYYKGANVTVTNNRIITPGGIGILVDDQSTYNTRGRVLIDGNTIADVSTGVACLQVSKLGNEAGAAGTPLESVIISNNEVRHATAIVGSSGIYVRAVNGSIDEVVVVGNKVRGPRQGILLETESISGSTPYIGGFTINSNLVRCASNTGIGADCIGVYLRGGTASSITSGTIIGNTFKGAPYYGIYCSNENHIVISQNNIHGFTNTAIITSAANKLIVDNLTT